MEGLLNKDKPNSLDELLEHKVGYGEGQAVLLRSIFILLFGEGCETIVIGLLIPKIGVEWQMGTFQKSALITMVYLGVSIGSYLETYSDAFGRYKFLLGNAILTSIFGLVSVFCSTFNLFLATRFFYGIGIGIILPLSATYITEVVPGSRRGNILTLSRIYWSLGCFIACFLGWFLLKDNHWRLLLFILCLPNFYAIYDVMQNCRESLRYLWVQKRKDEVIDLLNMMTDRNGRQNITEQEITDLMSKDDVKIREGKSSLSELFNEKYYKTTLILAVAWVSACFIYYAVMLILPSILARHASISDNFQYIFLMVISAFQVFSFYTSQFMMDNPSLGRKKSVYYLFLGIAILTALLIISNENVIVLFVVFIGLKIFSSCGFMILYPYSAEIYDTMIRSTAMGIFSLCGRIATTFLGIIGISSLEWMGGMGLYYIFILLSLSTTILIYQMPYCTLGRQLDI